MTTMHDKKKVSLFSAVALSATSMMGSGWLFSSQLNAKYAGNYAFIAWFIAALLVMCVGICLAKVVMVYPVRGATTRSSALSHNGMFGIPFAFANWFGTLVSVPNEAQATTEYLSSAINSTNLMHDGSLTLYGKLFAISILFIYLLINYYGIKILARVNNIVTILKVFTPLFAITIFLIAKFDTSNFYLPSNNIYNSGSIITAIVSAGLIYCYNGFQLSVAFASEIKNPTRNVPLAIIISIVLVMIVYMLLQLSFMGAVPHDMLINGGWASLNLHSPLMNLAIILGLNFLSMILIADSVISPSGTGYAYLGGSSRMFYAMAIEGQMPKWSIGRLHYKFNLCHKSLIINWLIAAITLIFSDSWASLMLIVSGYNIIGYMAAPISLGAIKPQYKKFGIVVFSILGIIISTLPTHDLLMVNISLSILIGIFTISQVINKIDIKATFAFVTPFVLYLWMIYVDQNTLFVIIISIIFYTICTSNSYVSFCKKYSITKKELDNE